MSGIAADEPLITRNRIDYLMGLGSTAEVLRNLCLLVHLSTDIENCTTALHH
jgi:hypothetical protein